MAFYEPQGWQAPAPRQVSWEQPAPPSRSGMTRTAPGGNGYRWWAGNSYSCVIGSSSVSQREEIPAFSSQFDGMPLISLAVVSSLLGRLFETRLGSLVFTCGISIAAIRYGKMC